MYTVAGVRWAGHPAVPGQLDAPVPPRERERPTRKPEEPANAATGDCHFDRGGFSAGAFRFLTTEGIGFITYLKDRKPCRLVPGDRFQRSWFAFEGTRQVYHVVEKATRVGRAGTLRTILVLGDEDQRSRCSQTSRPPSSRPRWCIVCSSGGARRTRSSFPRALRHRATYPVRGRPGSAVPAGAESQAEGPHRPRPPRHSGDADPGSRPRARRRHQRGTPTAHHARPQDRPHRAAPEAGRTAAHARPGCRIGSATRPVRSTRPRSAGRDPCCGRIAGWSSMHSSSRPRMPNGSWPFAFGSTIRPPTMCSASFGGFSIFPAPSTAADRLEVCLQRPDSPKVAHALEALLRDLNQDQARLFSDGPIFFTLARST